MGFGFAQGRIDPEYDEQRPHGHVYLDVRVVGGTTLGDACEEALKLSKQIGCGIRFPFNGVHVVAWPTSTKQEIMDRWRRQFGAEKGESA